MKKKNGHNHYEASVKKLNRHAPELVKGYSIKNNVDIPRLAYRVKEIGSEGIFKEIVLTFFFKEPFGAVLLFGFLFGIVFEVSWLSFCGGSLNLGHAAFFPLVALGMSISFKLALLGQRWQKLRDERIAAESVLFNFWSDSIELAEKLGDEPGYSAHQIVHKKLCGLALEITKIEMGAELSFPSVEMRLVLLREEIRLVAKVAAKFGLTDGNIKPYHDLAQAEWQKLAAKGLTNTGHII